MKTKAGALLVYGGIVLYLSRGKIEDAKAICMNESDKIRSYPKIVSWLKENLVNINAEIDAMNERRFKEKILTVKNKLLSEGMKVSYRNRQGKHYLTIVTESPKWSWARGVIQEYFPETDITTGGITKRTYRIQ